MSANQKKQKKKLPPGIEQRGDSYRAAIMINGQRLKETFDTITEAKEWIEDTRSAYRSGKFKLPSEGLKRWSVSDCLNLYVEKRLDGEKGNHGHISAIEESGLMSITLDRLSKAHVRKWKHDMIEDGLSDATVVKRLNLLAAVFNCVIRNTDLDFENPASSTAVERPRGSDFKRTRRLVGNEEALLFEAVSHSSYPDDGLLTRFALEQATRLSEAVNLTWGCVDLTKRTMALHRTKNEKHREEQGPEVRPLASGSVDVLKKKLESLPSAPSPDDRVFDVGSSEAFSVRFGRITKKAGFVDFRFHDLRHEATSRLAKKLPNPMDLKRVTGHRDLKSLDRYYQPDPSELAAKI